tara:strand:+ start:763 stop:1686 length:924 start_codon:yes stop_codon:yes gene_type:complete
MLLAAAALGVSIASTSSAALLIHEPFAYTGTGTAGDNAFLGDGNQSGATGLTGNWRQVNGTVNEIEVDSGGLTFTDGGGNALPASGGHARKAVRQGQNSASSNVSVFSTSELTKDNSTMWMSFIFQDNGFSGPTSALMLASEDMTASDGHSLITNGYGVGIVIRATANPLRAIHTGYYNGGTNYTRVAEATPTFESNAGPQNTSFLLAAKVNWKPDGQLDEIFVFNITDLTTEPLESAALASDTFDMLLVNQQSLDVLNIGETQIDSYDEIRFATTFTEVVGGTVPEPSSLALLGLGGLGLILRRRR